MMKSSLGRQGQEERRVPGTPEGAWPPTLRLALFLEKERGPAQLSPEPRPEQNHQRSTKGPCFQLLHPGSSSSLSFCFPKWDTTNLHGHLLSSSQRRIWDGLCCKEVVLPSPGLRSAVQSHWCWLGISKGSACQHQPWHHRGHRSPVLEHLLSDADRPQGNQDRAQCGCVLEFHVIFAKISASWALQYLLKHSPGLLGHVYRLLAFKVSWDGQKTGAIFQV